MTNNYKLLAFGLHLYVLFPKRKVILSIFLQYDHKVFTYIYVVIQLFILFILTIWLG